jgi:O-antigen ligase
VGGTAVLLLTIINPPFGLGITLLLAPLGALENRLWGNSIDSGQIFLLFTLGVWAARGLSRHRLVIPHTRLNIPLVFFIGTTFLTLFQAPSLTFGLKELLKWLEILLVMWLVIDLAPESPETRGENIVDGRRFAPTIWILMMLLLSGLTQAMVGIQQFLQEGGPEHFLILGRFYRAFGTFDQPNPFGGFMNLIALLALGALGSLLVMWWQKWRQEKQITLSPLPLVALSLFIGVCAALTTAALVASWSRGAWLGFAGGTAVLILFWPKKRWHGLGLLLMSGMLVWGSLQFDLLPASIAERLTNFSEDLVFGDVRGVDINDANYAVIERLAHWQAALGMARDHFWLGVGFGNYEPVYSDYALINWPYPLGHAHNYYLNLLAEIGVLGLLAYVGVWTAVFHQNIRLLSQLDGVPRGIALGLLAAFAALTVHHLVDKLYVNNIYIHLGVMLGLLQLLSSTQHITRKVVAI